MKKKKHEFDLNLDKITKFNEGRSSLSSKRAVISEIKMSRSSLLVLSTSLSPKFHIPPVIYKKYLTTLLGSSHKDCRRPPLDRITKRPIKTQPSRGKVNSGKYMQTLVLSKIDEDPKDGVHERNHLLNWQTRKHHEVKYQTCIN
ncbi:hypothetical protein YC2023_061855 [Brassica napus]